MKGPQWMDPEGPGKLYERSLDFVVEASIESSVTESSLSLSALKFVGAILEAVQPGVVFEFGSGLSTRFMARVLEPYPSSSLYTLDHSSFYSLQARENMPGNARVTFLVSPIALYRFRLKAFATYDPSYLRRIPQGVKFDAVVVDGPPGYRFGREAVLYQIAPFLKAETLILLDDANREPEREAVSHWKRVWSSCVTLAQFPQLKKGLALLRITEPRKMRLFPFAFSEIIGSWIDARRKIEAESRRRG